jgi:hypothetical protein
LKDCPIKIAVIDNGTDRLNDTLAMNISKGVSYARSSSTRAQLLPWYIASDAHGTQMAYLIRTINPHCCIYPIRVGMVRDDIQPKAAIQVRAFLRERNWNLGLCFPLLLLTIAGHWMGA